MRTKKIIIPLLLTVLLFNLSSCTREPYEDCTLSFRVNFIDKNTGECYKHIDSLLLSFGLDTLCLYAKPNSLGGVKGMCMFRNDDPVGSCLYMTNGGMSFDKRKNPTFTYALGKFPNYIDTIEFKYNGSVAEIRINGVLQEQKAVCGEEAQLSIIK